jgi:hypothetical protein
MLLPWRETGVISLRGAYFENAKHTVKNPKKREAPKGIQRLN